MNKKLITYTETIAATALLVWAVGVSIWLQRYSMVCTDYPYQILNAIDPESSPASIFSSYCMYIWGQAFGFDLLSMRYCMVALAILTAFSASIYFYLQTHKLSASIALMALGVIGANYLNVIGWDAFTNLFTIICIIISLNTINNPTKTSNYILLGGISALLFLSRFPNVVVLPFSIGMIWLANRRSTAKTIWKNMTIYLITTLTITAMIIHVITGGFRNYIQLWDKYGLISGHEVRVLLRNYYLTFEQLLLFFTFLFILHLLTMWSLRWVGKKGRPFTITVCELFFLITTLFIYTRMHYFNTGTFSTTQFFMISLSIFTLYAQVSNNPLLWIKVMVIAMLCLIPPAGSDMGLRKTLSIYVLPIIFSLGKLTKSQRTIIWGVATAFVIYLLPGKRAHILFDAGYPLCTAPVESPMVKGVYTTPENAENYNKIIKTAKKLDGEVLFLGKGSLWYEYFFMHRPTFTAQIYYRNLNDRNYVNAVLQYLNEERIENIIIT